jgi:hypothetical protein
VGRLGLAELGELSPDRHLPRILALAFAVALLTGLVGVLCGLMVSRGDLRGWQGFQDQLNVVDLPAFVVVAYLHWASYLGAALGLLCAIVYVKRQLARAKIAATPSSCT